MKDISAKLLLALLVSGFCGSHSVAAESEYYVGRTPAVCPASAQAPAAERKAKPSQGALELRQFIAGAMPESVLPITSEGYFKLPKPYSVPCRGGGFRDMFYWDTYFTNAGLLTIGDKDQALNNIEDIAWLIDTLGYMPNGTGRGLINRTQPPLFCMMVRDYFDATADTLFLERMMPRLEKEYTYWMTNRLAPNGLNRYGHSATDAELIDFCKEIAQRVRIDPSTLSDEARKTLGAHLLAEAESGWDFNPRFKGRCMDFNPVDLNAILYGYERNMADFIRILRREGAGGWEAKAAKRKALMDSTMIDPATDLYFDYDYVNDCRSDVYSAAVFWPLWQGAASAESAARVVESLPRLETAYGILTCELRPGEEPFAQWDAPNGWAPLHYAAFAGLDRAGYPAEAARIARKYVDVQTDIFGATRRLWEKHNALQGNHEAHHEYDLSGEFLGWTAGTYLAAYKYLYGE